MGPDGYHPVMNCSYPTLCIPMKKALNLSILNSDSTFYLFFILEMKEKINFFCRIIEI